MKGKTHSTEEIIRILRQADGGQTAQAVCREYNISEQTFYQWKKKYGGMELADAKRLTELEKENAEFKKMLAESMLENRLAEIVEEVGEFLRPKEPEIVPALYRQVIGLEQESATPIGNKELRNLKMVEEAGIEPVSLQHQTLHQPCKCIALQCVPRIHTRALLQEDCTKIAVLCIKTMPYLCHRIWQM